MADDANDPTLPHFKRTRERGREQRLTNIEENADNLDTRVSALEAAKGAKGGGKAFIDLEARVTALEAAAGLGTPDAAE